MFVFSHIFPLLWEFTYPIFWEFYGFLLHPKYLRNPTLWNVCVFPYFSCIMEIQFFYVLGTAWISVSSAKISETLNFWNVCVFSYIPLTMGIHFFYVLGIIWISTSPKIFEKTITLEFLFFTVIFPYYGNSLFPHFGNVWISTSSELFKKPINLKCLFSHTFPVLWKSTFSMCWELHGFLLQAKNSRNPYLWNACVFPYFFLTVLIPFSHILGIVCINSTHVISHVFGILWVSISRE